MKARLLLVALAVALLGCGSRVEARVARGFVELKGDSTYDFRAVAPEGAAVAARVVDLKGAPADLAFWEHALELRVRELEGYARLEAKDAELEGGVKGRELVFGHDEDGKPYVYRVRFFLVDGGRLLLVEAGGSRDQMKRLGPGIDWMMARIKPH